MNRQMAKVPSSIVADPTNYTAPTSWDDTLWGTNDLLESPTETIHSTFMPLHYEAGYSYPLLVWLHGDGDDESVLPAVMQHISTRNQVASAPRGTTNLGEREFGWKQSAAGILDAEQAVTEAIEETADRFNIHSDRVFIAGSGSGGTMALRLALRRPEWFAGCASFNGGLPTGERPLSRIKEIRKLPLLLAIQEASDTYSESELCANLSLLHSAGCEVGIRHYQGEGDLQKAMLEDLNRWLMDIILS